MKNPNHSINYAGRKFFTANIVDKFDTHHGDYDMTIIFVEKDDDLPPEVVNYYYGDPNLRITIDYIMEYVNSQPSETDSCFIEKDSESELANLRNYKRWFDDLVSADKSDEEIDRLCNSRICLTVDGRSIDLAFDAENYHNVERLLRRAIEEF